MNQNRYIDTMDTNFRLHVVFYRTPLGNEPVREWLKQLSHAEKKIIGEDIKTVGHTSKPGRHDTPS